MTDVGVYVSVCVCVRMCYVHVCYIMWECQYVVQVCVCVCYADVCVSFATTEILKYNMTSCQTPPMTSSQAIGLSYV